MKHALSILLCGVFLVGGISAEESFDPFADGRKLFEEKKYSEALEKFQKSLEYLPHDPTILSWLGATYLSLGKYPEAEQALTEALERGGTAYKFFELLCAVQVRQGKWDAALGTIRRFGEVGTPEEKKENEGKLKTLEAAIHLEKRLECLKREPPDRACADAELEAAWQLHAEDPAQDVSFAQIWTSKGLAEQDPTKKAEDFARAEASARRWVESAAPSEKTRAKIGLATVLSREKKFDQAIPLLQEIRQLDPANCNVRLELTRAYLAKEDYQQAKTAATDAIECRPDDMTGYLLRATAEYALEDCPSVLKDGAEYAKRAPGKEQPKFVTYCKNVLDSKRAEADRQKYAQDYKKWIEQQLKEGDEKVEEALNPHRNGKKDDKDKKNN